MDLGAQTHFGQGWKTTLLSAADTLALDFVRDGLPWNQIETTPGVYDFSIAQAGWLTQARTNGVDVMLTFAHTNPLYDNGETIYSDIGLAAFAQFIVATLREFPNVKSIEIGNEFNSNSFVSGEVARAPKSLRSDYYARQVEAVHDALDKAGLDVAIVGGATHSIPVDYFAQLKAHGTLDLLDALSIHPYTTPPEQFEDQIAVLRNVIGPDIGIRATEFGDTFTSLEEAPAYLAKMVSVMAASGVESASWYALARQSWFPNMELWDPKQGAMTPAGTAFETIGQLLEESGTVTHLQTNDFTYLYGFGDHAAVLWGAANTVELADGVSVYDLFGQRLDNFDGRINPDVPIILRTDGTITADSIQFGDNHLVADSFDQFDVLNETGSAEKFEGPWSYFAQNGEGKLTALYTMGGGLKGGEPWTPYLGTDWLRPLEVNATTLTPVDFGKNAKPAAKYAVVERFTAELAGTYTVKADYDVSDSTSDGVELTVTVNGSVALAKTIYDPANGNVFSFSLDHLALQAGDQIDFIIGSGLTPRGDMTQRHIQIFTDNTLSAQEGHTGQDSFSWHAEGSSLDESGAAASIKLDLQKGIVKLGALKTLTEATDAIGSQFADNLSGNAQGNRLEGGAGNDTLQGRAGDDWLLGGTGNDRLDGGTGADRMEGGAGNDIYYLDDIRDHALEKQGKGNDTVRASMSYALEANIENLTLTGTANIDATGNGLSNVLRGNDGRNILRGGDGADKLYGGGDADIFIFDNTHGIDKVADFQSGYDKLALDDAIFGGLHAIDAQGSVAFGLGTKAIGSGAQIFYDTSRGSLYYDPDGHGGIEASVIAILSGHPALALGDIILL